MADECIFCQLLANPDQTLTVHETDDFRAWLDINPRAKGHTMVVPKDHLKSAEELGGKLKDMFDVARIVGEKAVNGLGADGYSIVVNNGEAAGQMMDHFYMIVFPRFSDEESSGTPTGAIFRPKEDLDENDLRDFMAKMESASFNDHSGGSPPPEMRRDYSSDEEESNIEKKEESKSGSDVRKGNAEFR